MSAKFKFGFTLDSYLGTQRTSWSKKGTSQATHLDTNDSNSEHMRHLKAIRENKVGERMFMMSPSDGTTTPITPMTQQDKPKRINFFPISHDPIGQLKIERYATKRETPANGGNSEPYSASFNTSARKRSDLVFGSFELTTPVSDKV